MTDTTEIAFILDQSGSMESIKKGTLEGVNSFLLQQQQENAQHPVRFNLTLFSTDFEVRHSSVPVLKVPALTLETYRPGGGTALLDAIGTTVVALGKRLAAAPEAERPGQVVVAVMTDGEENSSRQFTWKQISDMIRHQTEVYKWQFLFLGANQDAIATASKINIAQENSATFFHSHKSSRSAARAISAKMAYLKTGLASPSMTHLYAQEEDKPE
jgi:Mg-chelatase subunit ChlD